MKAVIYTLLLTLGLSGICQHAHANTHNRKYTHHTTQRLIKEQFADRESLTGDEDEDDQNDFTRRYLAAAKPGANINNSLLIHISLPNNKRSATHALSPPPGDICISCRVLRI
jgi:hypothetical protein